MLGNSEKNFFYLKFDIWIKYYRLKKQYFSIEFNENELKLRNSIYKKKKTFSDFLYFWKYFLFKFFTKTYV